MKLIEGCLKSKVKYPSKFSALTILQHLYKTPTTETKTSIVFKIGLPKKTQFLGTFRNPCVGKGSYEYQYKKEIAS